jgi:large subunit ribosomal protein L17
MNNRPKITKLAGNKAHSDLLKRSLLTDLVTYEYLETTASKAKAIVPLFDKLINTAKIKDKRHAEAKLNKILFSKLATDKVMNILVKRLGEDQGGYLNLYKTGLRKGDNAPMIKMIVKGYVYKEIGVKKSDKKAAKQTETNNVSKKFEVNEIKDMSQAQSQNLEKGSQGKAKSRSGI